MRKLVILVIFGLFGCSRSYDWVLDMEQLGAATYFDIIENTENIWEAEIGPISTMCYSIVDATEIREVALLPDECGGQSNAGCLIIRDDVASVYIKTGKPRELQLGAVEHSIAHIIARCTTGDYDLDHQNGTELFMESRISCYVF